MTAPESSEVSSVKDLLDRPVVVIGMMGSGKSRVGRGLADKLGFDFYDSDKVIEEKAGATVSEIFEKYGEAKFRESERKAILELLEKGPCVIASGGGAVMNPGVMEAIRKKAVSVWLKTDVDRLAARLEKAGGRPLLKQGDPVQILTKLLEEREPVYSLADITIETGQDSFNKTMQDVLKGLCGFLKQGKV
ncbi:MAG: shikimate kinase [Alphaproteobacteria bacterium]|nr:shikimate kinase [Alphaproteobacteria bacterium]